MILETAGQSSAAYEQKSDIVQKQQEHRPVLKMKKHDRMGGSVPVWEEQNTAKEKIEGGLTYALQSPEEQFQSALAYADAQDQTGNTEKPFGFGDLIDIVNPLQHIPVVGHIYRHISGDEIRPTSKIVGGAIFGGAAGAAAGIVDVIAEEETGRDMADNALYLAQGGTYSSYKESHYYQPETDPQTQLDNAAKAIEKASDIQTIQQLPGNTLSFVDMSATHKTGVTKRQISQRIPIGDGRTAGTMVQTQSEVSIPRAEREPITSLNLSPMPPRYEFHLNS